MKRRRSGSAQTEPPRSWRPWSDFQDIFSEFAGISLQAFDERGEPFQPAPALPKLCDFLQRNPETAAACRKDCFRKTSSCRDATRTLAARCYAGLSYRIVPIRLGRRPHSVILVGRVLTEVFGGEQCLALVERFHLPRESFLESLAGVRSVGNADLDRVAGGVRRLAFSFAASRRRLEQGHVRLGRLRGLLALAGTAASGAVEEARLLGEMAEKCLAARSVDELLPLALDAMMHSLHARRGSILLADSEQGRVVARALRGEHAPISRSIETLAPGSVSHRVFFERRPLLVQDVGREPGLASVRQFPYSSRSFVSVPLRADDGALGVLHLTEREGEGVFTPGDLSLLERLSFQAAGAICRIRLEEEVRSLRVASTTDHLTGMHNRRYLDERLAAEFQRASRFGQQLAVVMVDLDRFKDLNDLRGHEYGDRVLRAIAGSIRGLLRSVDIIARYGGDEFVLVLPETGVAGALSTVEKIREHLARPDVRAAISPEVPAACSVSVGVSVYPGTGGSVEELLRRADEALLKAKSAGRDTALVWNG